MQLPRLCEYESKLQGHLRYERQLQVDFNEKFYKPFRKFIEEKFFAEERLRILLEGRKIDDDFLSQLHSPTQGRFQGYRIRVADDLDLLREAERQERAV